MHRSRGGGPRRGHLREWRRGLVAANKVSGVRACLIHETFSAHQGVEDDNLNVMCLGGRVVGDALAWELVKTFLAARFSGPTSSSPFGQSRGTRRPETPS